MKWNQFGKLISLIIFVNLICNINLNANSSLNIIPKPKKMEKKSGQFNLNKETKIIVSKKTEEMLSVADYLQNTILSPTGYKLSIEQGKAAQNSIYLDLDKDMQGKNEGYKLLVSENKVKIRANSSIGCFYGVQTLRQLFPSEFYSNQILSHINWQIPAVKIKDAPRFEYRGLHLDVGRHFFPVSFIKKYIDLLAMHKMNRFHWHLTEDQGWRIEIKQYPKLTKIGAFREETVVGHARNSDTFDGESYGGYYTQEEVKEIVKYAQKRHITIIPEIEMPGHSRAALSAYPELGCTEGTYEVATTWGVHEEVYCAGKEKTFTFLKNVLDEVMALFPGKYIHIGGDECPKDRWEECSDCQKRIKEEGLENEKELQSYFIKRIEKYIVENGRRIIGWDEILEGGLPPEATVMSWRGIEGGIEAAKQNHDVIMTPSSHCYLDHYQSDPKTEPLAIGGHLTLENCYSYEPVPEELNSEEAEHILGVQGNVWTEYMKTSDYVEYMAYPRAIALAEVGWSAKENREFSNFKKRLDEHYRRLDQMNVNYFQEIPKPETNKDVFSFIESYDIELSCPRQNAEIYYTTNGMEPDKNSTKYSNPIKLNKSAIIKAVTYLPGCNEYSKTKTIRAEKLNYMQPEKPASLQKGLKGKYYEGEFKKTEDLQSANSNREFTINNIQVPDFASETHFGVKFKGYLKIEEKGIYTFYLTSDDGSQLTINNNLIISNDGFHAPEEEKGNVALKEGYYPINLDYFQGEGGYLLNLKLKKKNTDKKDSISKSNLFHK